MVARMNSTAEPAGETTITGKNQVSLPSRGVRQLGWERGDRLLVHVLGHDLLLLSRKPDDPAAYFAGKLGHVFGTHEETLRFLEQERASWDDGPRGAGVRRRPEAPSAPVASRSRRAYTKGTRSTRGRKTA
jgi:hypothetical protein